MTFRFHDERDFSTPERDWYGSVNTKRPRAVLDRTVPVIRLDYTSAII